MIIGRRSFLTGLLAAPLVIHSGVLMPVRALIVETAPAISWVAGDLVSNDAGEIIGIYSRDGQMLVGSTMGQLVSLPPAARKTDWADLGQAPHPDYSTAVTPERIARDIREAMLSDDRVVPLPPMVYEPVPRAEVLSWAAQHEEYWAAELLHPGQTAVPYIRCPTDLTLTRRA